MLSVAVQDSAGHVDPVAGVLAQELVADPRQRVGGGIEGELAQAAHELAGAGADEEVRVVHRAEPDPARERDRHPGLEVEAVELVELRERVADRVVRRAARTPHAALVARVVEALAEVHTQAGHLPRVADREVVGREDPRAVVRAALDGDPGRRRGRQHGRRRQRHTHDQQARPNASHRRGRYRLGGLVRAGRLPARRGQASAPTTASPVRGM